MTGDLEFTIRGLYSAILAGWNAHDADAFAAPFADDGQVIGFDGSETIGKAAIAGTMSKIFAHHATGSYVEIVRSVRQVGGEAALLRAVSGVVPAGHNDLKPELNAMQSLVAELGGDGWRVVLYHNTPAAFHGRPDLVEALTEELRAAMRAQGKEPGPV